MKKAAAAFLLATTLLAGATAPALQAQEAPASGPLSFEAFLGRFDQQKDAFARFRFLVSPEAQATTELEDFNAQLLAAQYSFLGRPNDAVREFPYRVSDPAPPGMPAAAGFEAVPAADWIATQAQRFQVVMVNEAHHKPQTRLLTLALLPGLHDLGFTYLAAETFGEHPLEHGYPTLDTGHYTQEPVFAELVRRAAELGYTLVPYESAGGESQQSRETGQARRLAELLARDPDAKILVHAGYGHISEAAGTQPDGADPMALEFERLTGLPVLTLDQTKLAWEDGKAADRLARAFGIASPSVLLERESGQAWSAFPGRFDASVVLPPVDTSALRPEWLSLGGTRRAVTIDMTPCIGHLPCLAEARYAEEGDDAIPADQFLLLDRSETGTPLYLAPGRYRLRLLGADGSPLSEPELTVPATYTESIQ